MKIRPCWVTMLILMPILFCSCAHKEPEKSESTTISMDELFGTEEEAKRKRKEFEEKVKNDPNYQAHKRGDKLMKEKKYDAAIQEYGIAIQAEPDDHVAYAKKGIALYRSGKPAIAIKAFDTAIAVNRGPHTWNWWPLFHKGNALGMMRQLDDAIDAYTQSLKLNDSYKCYYFRGLAYQMKNDFKSSLADYDASLKRYGDNAAAHNGKAYAHLMLGVSERDKEHHFQACVAMRSACELGDCRLLNEFTQCRQK